MENHKQNKMRLAVVGAGSRGRAYCKYAEMHPDKLEILAVAEPDAKRLAVFGDIYDVPGDMRFASWQELLQKGIEADAVLITTPDREHKAPAIAFMKAGFNILLEKPIAPSEADCDEIFYIMKKYNPLIGVCHVLLYTPHTKLIKGILDSGRIGRIVSIQRLEPVGFWHYIHSYVRGNWRREEHSSSMLLAKSCHDIDWILHIMGTEIEAVQSFGSLNHFNSGNKPAEAASRCLYCPIEKTCPYSAKRFYENMLAKDEYVWPLDIVIDSPSPKKLREALEKEPYGRCVYSCDNNVVDNQVVNLKFTDGRTANLTVTAFTDVSHRKTRIFGTRGMIETDGANVRIYDFLSDSWDNVRLETGAATADQGHGGGDFGLMDAYLKAWESKDYSIINGNTIQGFASHKVVFAAEKSRLENKTVLL
jgi:predicted dehydrogenase